ncbi:AzlC family ABC transporter permease [Lactobacillus agilis]|uniref:AzlC family ABC transporter permease n=1 Tax=Ligilactobacillus agilis TaxID=1601 RepID=A0A848CEP5_9LACO|nr:AzlC family ABC transporter permease [Ligilactobacillus agilis]NME43130.1 AzlC family ABC transporter permease [Ligilactobacillus agilis]
MDANLDRKTALKDVLPTAFGYVGIGLAFGIVGKASGLSVLELGLMSLIAYGGSAQFIMVSMMLAHSPILSIVLAAFLVNARMILMSFTTAPYFKADSLLKNIFVGSLLTDESFALAMNKLNVTKGQLSFAWFDTINWFAYFTWFFATIAGALLGNFITNPAKLGVDFALVAMFIGLLYLQLISDKSLAFNLQLSVIVLTLGLVFVGMIFIPTKFLVLVVTLITCLLGMVIKYVYF